MGKENLLIQETDIVGSENGIVGSENGYCRFQKWILYIGSENGYCWFQKRILLVPKTDIVGSKNGYCRTPSLHRVKHITKSHIII